MLLHGPRLWNDATARHQREFPLASSSRYTLDVRALIVEDDEALATSLAELLQGWHFFVETAHDSRSARAKLAAGSDIVLLDLTLRDGSAMPLAREMCGQPTAPAVVAVSGTASAAEAFELAKMGARGYLHKPVSVPDLQATLGVLVAKPSPLETVARAQVGKLSYQDATAQVRRAMVCEALALTRGNKTGAARILQVSRQAVQQLIRDMDLDAS